MKAAILGVGVCCMSRRQKDPLRPLGVEERNELTCLSRSRSAPAAQGIRARTLLAVAAGQSDTKAASWRDGIPETPFATGCLVSIGKAWLLSFPAMDLSE